MNSAGHDETTKAQPVATASRPHSLEGVDTRLLEDLIGTPGLSGYETPVQELLIERFAGRFVVSRDPCGNVWAMGAENGAPLICVAAHADQVGMVVTGIDEDGFLRIDRVGLVSAEILVGRQAVVHTTNGPIIGAIGTRPPHLCEQDGRGADRLGTPTFLDIGAASAQRAAELVRVGDPITFATRTEWLDGARLSGAALDDRVGVYAAFRALELFGSERSAAASLMAVSTVREETGFTGARAFAPRLKADILIVVDVAFAGDDPTVRGHPHRSSLRLGGGPVLARGGGSSEQLVRQMLGAAGEHGIPTQFYAVTGESETDTDHLIGGGTAATVIVKIPLRYMHSPVEVVDVNDVEATARLIVAFAAQAG
jgi:putative aminopeptidase FrvX